MQAIKKGGEEFPIELTLGSSDDDGKRYYSGIIRDISEKKKAELIILKEKRKSDEPLLNILPKQVADELKTEGKATTKIIENVTILFTDFKDFTSMASAISPVRLVEELNEIFSHEKRSNSGYMQCAMISISIRFLFVGLSSARLNIAAGRSV